MLTEKNARLISPEVTADVNARGSAVNQIKDRFTAPCTEHEVVVLVHGGPGNLGSNPSLPVLRLGLRPRSAQVLYGRGEAS
ncbi:MAG: hypothetical protein A3G87_09630 [Omnitrophica bacterium RIFCSPLOWO2_12_FULL_50_11]|nr:MAG: hypothetical protein A3G87_09630 [Omnitrophica bacterium RIFCSPLOWO2_12_FULL_50_11]